MLIGVSIVISCSKNDETVVSEKNDLVLKNNIDIDSKTILEDQEYLDYVTAEYNFFQGIQDAEKIKNYASDGIIDATEGQDIFKAYGFNSHEAFVQWNTDQSIRYQNLDGRYSLSERSAGMQQELFLGALQKVDLLKFTPPFDPGSTDSCNSAFNWCMGTAMASAAVAHGACLLIDTASGGIAIYFCHSAALLLQVTMEGQCLDSYKTCKQSKG